jgi:dihydroxyacetone kinase-like predicted kinase
VRIADGGLDRLLRAELESAGDGGVAVLPNSARAIDAAEAAVDAARAAGRLVAVVPTRSVVQGLAALAVHDPSRPFRDDLVSMASAAAATRTVEVTVDDGGARGCVDGALVVSGDDPFTVGAEVLDKVLIGGGDLVTIVTGERAGDLGERLRAYVTAIRPAVEVQLHHGGQREPLVVAGVE